MSRENVEIVRQVFEASGRGDSDAVLALYDPDVEWDASRTTPAGEFEGVERGHEALRGFFRRWREAWDLDEYGYEDLMDGGDVVIATAVQRTRGRTSGVPVTRTLAGVWEVREGKVVRVVWYPSRQEALDAVGLRE